MTIKIEVEPADQPYLDIQVGEISEFVGTTEWHELYEEHLLTRMITIEHFLPVHAREYADIGGGLSGISILLNMFYGNNLHVNVIDGDGPPVMYRHAFPFSSHERTHRFLHNNGVRNVSVWKPTNLPPQKFDLITSFRAWCFHFEPSLYLEWVRHHLAKDGVLILDVRKDRMWIRDLREVFSREHKILDSLKGALWQFRW